ncbi:hypothetical protein M427DRAFT_56422 [Gonapodya prolifera JEL478]|uniref:Uncharacterized protein n=1 Tax=Gonapodya prolifera (strain JEL478) TaxID=1344416 RepID=A0A139AGH5_GONPJ|nr:hypothetical protein M427DRAFT_56422 [Gonapodya prolifera JEL478]|eukprot:KXS15848.1 hypothetical protein M427DRAFT_56422 [Gonapodya prolifera JEL478]
MGTTQLRFPVVVLVTLIPDLQVFPVSLRALSVMVVGFSMLSALAVFVSNNYACNPVAGIGCTLFLIGNLGKWLTYALRIWMLTYRRNIVLLVLMGTSILLTTASFQWSCSSLTTIRVAPQICAPLDNPFTDRLSSGTKTVASY